MTNTNEIDWREEYKNYTSNNKNLELLENGPKSLTDSWILQSLYCRWKEIKGIREKPRPNLQSSFKEWNENL